jgi:hypothetical protein
MSRTLCIQGRSTGLFAVLCGAGLGCVNAGQSPPPADAGSGVGGQVSGTGTGGDAPGSGGARPGDAGSGGTGAGGMLGIGGNAGVGGNRGVGGVIVPPSSAPAVRVDFDLSGRPSSEVTELGYTAWPVVAAPSISNTVQGVTFTLARTGANGIGLNGGWSKVAVDPPNLARLVGDGVTVDGGDAGAQIQMTIHGLATGTHSLLVFLNQTTNVASVAPVNILVDGTVTVSKVAPTIGALADLAARSAYFTFPAQAGKDVVVLFQADTTSTAVSKNVMINGFELNTPNVAQQATNPSPADGDEHVDCDSGRLTLSWKGSSGATSHDVYFAEDLTALRTATRTSPLFQGNQTATTFATTGLYSMKTYYWRVDEVDAQNRLTPGNIWYFRPRQLAFPTAEGYGRFARGGRGGVVVHVTNLNDSGPGSFRSAIETEVGPRTIVFDIGGVIPLASRLTLAQNYVTVAGQTAPGKGIVIRAAPFGASGAHDAVIQDVRVRLGAGITYDGMGLAGSEHCIVDHCSISWTIDESFSSRNGKNITLQRTFISEALNVAGHMNYPPGTAHGYAASISGDIGSFHHNLLAHCDGRNWSLAGGLDAGGNFAGRLDIFNNVVYNWRDRATDGGAHQVNFVANYYKPGAATTFFFALNAQYDMFPGTQQYYFANNVMPGHFDETTQTAGGEVTGTPNGYSPWVTAPFFPSYATTQSAGDAYKSVLSDVGCTQPVFDDHDVRVVKETLNGTFTYRGSVSGLPGLPDNEADVGGYESYPTTTRASSWDSDGDGLPDWWETSFGLNPASPSGSFADSNADTDMNGFTQLDDYLQWMAKPHFFTSVGKSVTVNLAQAFAGYTSGPTYASAMVVNGSVSISGTTATFTPTRCGMASWRLTVTDSARSSMSKDMVAFVDAGTGTCP